MDDSNWIGSVRSEGDDFAATLTGDQDAPLTGCPGWTLADLTGHLGFIHRNVTQVLVTPADVEFRWLPAESPGPGADLEPWFRKGLDDLVDALTSCDPDEIGPSFIGPQPKRFWRRRQAQETMVHRWDAEAAIGDPTPLDHELAVDGIDEMLEVFVPRRHADRFSADGATAHLHATDALDGSGEWMVHFDPDKVWVERIHAKGDVAVQGAASDLLLMLWGRIDLAELTVFGDRSVIQQWRAGMTG